MLRIGRVGRPHGTEGAFVVTEPTDRMGLLDAGSRVLVAGREQTVEWRKGTPQRPIVKLAGADAWELRGEPISVPRSALDPLGDHEFLVDDLIGVEVVDGGRALGRVTDVLLMPSADVLEVGRGGREPLLVPLVQDAVRSIDLERGRIDVDGGFLGAD